MSPSSSGITILVAAALIFWLLVFGLDEQRWKEQASAHREAAQPGTFASLAAARKHERAVQFFKRR